MGNMFFINEAVNHTKEMAETFHDNIEKSIKNTCIYSHNNPSVIINTNKYKTKIFVTDKDSVQAIVDSEYDVAVLNFASYKFPGGGYLYGSMAQEEALCSESFLYNVLSNFNSFYEYNQKNLNNSLYMNRALFSPDVYFNRNGNEKYCSVLTCAAPNFGAFKNTDAEENYINTNNQYALKSRIDFILNIFYTNGCKNLILGAFGCGVFAQNPKEVATIFSELLMSKYNGCFETVNFAIPKSNRNNNYNEFINVFGG